ncbi:YebC/PmpR family DNA-binding transcriptional regulator [Candidatus Saccharibacteria bacterium]|nr:YebC/PmpR family DNA-binding transcriptional regulator [Candidatus Saccharibacteria bacterium]
MSGHSKWATIKRQKGANDAKRGALFTKLGNQIAVAARGGGDPSMNANLAMIIEKAKKAGMPLNNIERAIQRVTDKSAVAVEEATYEGYGPGGIAIIVECATDNKNRTYPDVRNAFAKNGGNLAEPGAVAFQFARKGMIRANFVGDADEAMMAAIEAGAEDAEQIEEGELAVYTDPKELAAVRDDLRARGLALESAELTYVPNTTIEITDAEVAGKIMKLMDALDDLADVVNVHSNFTIAE